VWHGDGILPTRTQETAPADRSRVPHLSRPHLIHPTTRDAHAQLYLTLAQSPHRPPLSFSPFSSTARAAPASPPLAAARRIHAAARRRDSRRTIPRESRTDATSPRPHLRSPEGLLYRIAVEDDDDPDGISRTVHRSRPYSPHTRRFWSSPGTGRLQSMEGFTHFDLYSVSPSLILVPMRPSVPFAAQLTPGSSPCGCFDSKNQEDGHG
jgi:hypothetical protein